VPLVGASLLAVATSSGALREKIGTYSQQLVSQIALNLDGEFRKIKGLTDDILISPEVSSRMVGYRNAREPDKIMARFIFSKMLQNKFLNLDYVDDVIMLFSPQGPEFPSDVIHSTDQYDWPVSSLDRLARTVSTTAETKNLGLTLSPLPGTSRTDIVLVRTIRNALADETLGHLLVVVDPERFSRIYRGVEAGQGSDLFVVDPSGHVVSSRHPSRAVGSAALPEAWVRSGAPAGPLMQHWEGQEHLIALASIESTGWTVAAAIPSSYLDSETGRIATQILVFSLGALLVALLVSLRIAEGFSAPLRNLEQIMERFGEGSMEARSAVGRDDELGRLQRSFNAMASDITRLMSRIDEEHRLRQLSELQVLEYQINPHFLYNTLDSINWMAQRAQQKEISAIVTALARFFRLSLSRGRETYRVQDEIDHAKAYLSISQMRYPDCFSYEFDVDPELLERLTLKIVLQPLVENAIKHGIDKRKTGGRILVTGRAVPDGLEWRVVDNGRGITEARRLTLLARMASGAGQDPEPGGFGLVNVNHRLQLNYGPAYGLSLEEPLEGGTCVRALLPWEAQT